MDIWDWIKGLKRWWWMLLVLPLLAAGISWLAAPEPLYESRWTVNIYFDDPMLTNNPAYIDFVLLDDLHLLMGTGVLGDVIYLRLPEDMQENLTRDQFGAMVDSSRKAHFVEIVISGDDPAMVSIVAEVMSDNLQEVTNHYLIPPTYRAGSATVNVLDPITEPAINTRPRNVFVGSITLGTFLASVAATGVAEWLRLSHRAKYGAR